MTDEARAFARKIAALPSDGSLRRLAAARTLAERTPEEAVQLLAGLVEAARAGQEPAKASLASFATALGAEAAHLAEPLRKAAQSLGRDEVEALFSERSPVQYLDSKVAAKRDALQFVQSLGHLKWKARLTRNPDELARFATSSEAAVIRNVLLNPRTTEALVVRIAARRPTLPDVLMEIWGSPRWNVCRPVRRALALNPYLPPAVGARILPLLGQPDWEEVSRDGTVHAELRAQAERLLALGTAQRSESRVLREDEALDPEPDGVTSTRSSPRDDFRNE